MKVKRLILSFVIGILFAFILIYSFELNTNKYCIEYTIEYLQHGNNQIFYSDKPEHFNEENAFLYDISAKKPITITEEINNNNTFLRIDLGYNDNTVQISDLNISRYNIKENITNKSIIQENGIQGIKYDEGIYSIAVEGIDPYIILDLSHLIDKTDDNIRQLQIIKNAASWIAALFLMIIVYIKYKFFWRTFCWILDIIREWRLILNLAGNDFKMKYAASYFGAVWAFIQPMITVIIYVIIFGVGFRSLPVEGVSYALWLTVGIIPWFFFSEALSSATNSLVEYNYLVKKVVFKIEVLPIVKIVSSIIVHMFFLIIAIIMQLIYGIPLTIYLCQFIYYTFCVIILAWGIANITSAITVFFKDMNYIINIILQLGMWATPIMYNITIFGKTGEKILKLNPMCYIVEGYRDAFFQHIWFWEKPQMMLYFWSVTGIILLIGIIVFSSLKKHFADVL